MTEKNYKILKTIFTAMLGLGVCVRLWQLISLIDFETGFFYNHRHPAVYIFYALVVIGSVGMIATEKIFYKAVKAGKEKSFTGIAGIGQAVMGIVMLITSISGIKTLSETVSGIGMHFKAINQAMGGMVFVLLPIFGIIGGAVLLVHAFCSISGRHFEDKISILSLMPVFWALFKVMACFTETASYIKQSDLFVFVFIWVFTMVGMLVYNRKLTGIGFADTAYLMYPVSICAVVFSLMGILDSVFAKTVDGILLSAAALLFFACLLPAKNTEDNTVKE